MTTILAVHGAHTYCMPGPFPTASCPAGPDSLSASVGGASGDHSAADGDHGWTEPCPVSPWCHIALCPDLIRSLHAVHYSWLYIHQTVQCMYRFFRQMKLQLYIHTAHGALYCNNTHSNASVKVLQKYTLLTIMLCNHTVHIYMYMYCTLSYLHQVHTYIRTYVQVSVHTYTHAYVNLIRSIKFTSLLWRRHTLVHTCTHKHRRHMECIPMVIGT